MTEIMPQQHNHKYIFLLFFFFLVFLRENSLIRLVKYNLGRISLSVDRSETSDALIYVALLKHIFNLTL